MPPKRTYKRTASQTHDAIPTKKISRSGTMELLDLPDDVLEVILRTCGALVRLLSDTCKRLYRLQHRSTSLWIRRGCPTELFSTIITGNIRDLTLDSINPTRLRQVAEKCPLLESLSFYEHNIATNSGAAIVLPSLKRLRYLPHPSVQTKLGTGKPPGWLFGCAPNLIHLELPEYDEDSLMLSTILAFAPSVQHLRTGTLDLDPTQSHPFWVEVPQLRTLRATRAGPVVYGDFMAAIASPCPQLECFVCDSIPYHSGENDLTEATNSLFATLPNLRDFSFPSYNQVDPLRLTGRAKDMLRFEHQNLTYDLSEYMPSLQRLTLVKEGLPFLSSHRFTQLQHLTILGRRDKGPFDIALLRPLTSTLRKLRICRTLDPKTFYGVLSVCPLLESAHFDMLSRDAGPFTSPQTFPKLRSLYIPHMDSNILLTLPNLEKLVLQINDNTNSIPLTQTLPALKRLFLVALVTLSDMPLKHLPNLTQLTVTSEKFTEKMLEKVLTEATQLRKLEVVPLQVKSKPLLKMLKDPLVIRRFEILSVPT